MENVFPFLFILSIHFISFSFWGEGGGGDICVPPMADQYFIIDK